METARKLDSEERYIIPFKAEHLGRGDTWDSQLKEKRGQSFTAMCNGEIIGCAGMLELWAGVGEVWTLEFSKDPKHRLWLNVAVMSRLRQVVREHKYWRVQAYSIYTNTEAREWLCRLGFRPEGVSWYYGPNGEHLMRYAKIYEENLPK